MAVADDIALGGLEMGGNIVMSSNKITGLAAGTAAGDALSFGQSGASLAGLALTNDIDMNSNKITVLGTPTADTDAATKGYVDGVAEGLDVHESVRCATTAAGTLASSFENGDNVDGVSLVTGNRILIKNQVSAVENGIYIVQANGAPVRADDWAATYEAAGAFVFVEEGTANSDSGWVCTSDGSADTTGTHALNFSQFSGAGQITAGTGLTKSGNTINAIAGNGINVNADDIEVKPDTSSTTTTEANAIVVGANGVSVKVDNSSLEGSGQGAAGGEALRIKAEGIVGGMLAGDITYTTTGDITANSFSGDGSGLTNLPSAASTDAVSVAAVKSTAGSISKGQVVHLVGYNGTEYTVELADADSASLMPAIGIVTAAMTEASAGTVVVSGRAGGLNTSTYSAGDSLYISATAGTLTTTKPTGATTAIQRIGEVASVNASTGEILVLGAGRSNDVPNIAQDNMWIGNSSGVSTPTPV
ncbi:MAG: hypothetical protein HKO76_05900, partial [Acidimicrobiia bacterium]|nr:hypothetical protein [Acidimicrobiia bacterium]